MNKPIKIGIFGLYRGGAYIRNLLACNADLVAVCDRDKERLRRISKILGKDVALYEDYESLINHPGLDAVVLCNTFDQHTPFAIRALEKNIHVLSECASNSTMAEGVALVRAVEKSKAIYMLGENFPFMKYNLEMGRIFKSGSLGKLLYAEGEYNHPQDPSAQDEIRSLRPHEKHWRNFLPRSYYITHSLGPLMHMTGATPVRVTAMPVFAPFPTDPLMGLAVGDRAAIITCLNDDDSVFRVTGCAAFGSHENSYRICGVKGQTENLRDGSERILVSYNQWDAQDQTACHVCYEPEWKDKDQKLIEAANHGGSDFLVVREFLDCIRHGRQPFFDVYRATTMASVAILSHRSLLQRGVPYDIPDFRKEEDRLQYQDDTLTPFYGADGSEPTLPCCSHPDHAPREEDVLAYQELLAQDPR